MKLVISDDAEQELRDAICWYDDQGDGLGQNLEQAVFDVIERIRSNPLLGSLMETLPERDDVRRIRVKRFPYHVIYEMRRHSR